MAEEAGDIASTHTAETPSKHVPSGVEFTPPALNVKRQQLEDSAPSPASENTEATDDNGEDVEQNVGNGKNKMAPLPEGSLSPEEHNSPNMDENSSLRQADNESRGDYNRESTKNEEPIKISREIPGEEHTDETEASETTTAIIQGDTKDDQIDGPKVRLNEESTATNDTNTQAGEDVKNVFVPEEEEETQGKITTLPLAPVPQSMPMEEFDEKKKPVESISAIIQEPPEPIAPEVIGTSGGTRRYLIAVGIVALVAILWQHLLQSESPPQKTDVRQIDIFLEQLEKLKTLFPNQRTELWNRSRIHLRRHLQTARPTEPVSLILTAGLSAERSLRCLAQGLASAFSFAHNASVLHIDGARKAGQDSDQVKLDIDSKLQRAFEGDKPVAVIHRFEELPPGSTLIFYRYCDHENAAYKKTFIIFTVLLGEEEAIPAKIHLSAVEEMVDDHLQKKFLSHDHPVSFDKMDLDKYGGLWSRISHLILPVAAEERIERDGC
ncbi:torsin-1A-interacting protein 2-like isoform X1 [Embiotoca jacksoni]|uniref:torsin-1A-interacting protein 2-like isoform X1 n=1 Tax=Embiotoca jacksoni TaxID=100190 RepID=UPI0037048DF5